MTIRIYYKSIDHANQLSIGFCVRDITIVVFTQFKEVERDGGGNAARDHGAHPARAAAPARRHAHAAAPRRARARARVAARPARRRLTLGGHRTRTHAQRLQRQGQGLIKLSVSRVRTLCAVVVDDTPASTLYGD